LHQKELSRNYPAGKKLKYGLNLLPDRRYNQEKIIFYLNFPGEFPYQQ